MGLVVGFALALGAGFVIHKSTSLIFEYGWRWAWPRGQSDYWGRFGRTLSGVRARI
jgi:hypothetical protein